MNRPRDGTAGAAAHPLPLRALLALAVAAIVLVMAPSGCLSTPHAPLRVAAPNSVLPPVTTSVEALADSSTRMEVQRHSVEGHPGFLLGFVEFDDQGEFWNRGQVDQLEHAIRERFSPERMSSALVLVFAHGWNHDAGVCDEHVACFRELLTHLHEDDLQIRNAATPPMKPELIVGVFVGWRGRSVRGPLSPLSFFARNSAARRVGNGSLVELLARLDVLVRRLDAGTSERSRLVLAGHSFGATVLYTALANILKNEVARAVADDGPAAVPGPGPAVVKGFGDLLVLVNPAFEASLLANLHDLTARGPPFSPYQPPLLVVVSSETDRATSTLFPFGRWLDTLFQNTQGTDQRRATRTAVGNFDPFLAYRLERVEVPDDGRTAAPEEFEVSRCACRLAHHPMDPDELSELVSFWSADGIARRSTPGTSAEADAAEESRSYGRARLVCARPPCRPNPIWVVSATRDVLDGHGQFFTDTLVDFVRWVVLENGLRQSAYEASAGR